MNENVITRFLIPNEEIIRRISVNKAIQLIQVKILVSNNMMGKTFLTWKSSIAKAYGKKIIVTFEYYKIEPVA